MDISAKSQTLFRAQGELLEKLSITTSLWFDFNRVKHVCVPINPPPPTINNLAMIDYSMGLIIFSASTSFLARAVILSFTSPKFA